MAISFSNFLFIPTRPQTTPPIIYAGLLFVAFPPPPPGENAMNLAQGGGGIPPEYR